MPGRKRCNPKGDKFAICDAAGTQCGPSSGKDIKDVCEGSTLVFCDDGYTKRIDCKALGFSTCGTFGVNSIVLGATCK